jgi:hypothetical protein
MCDGPWLGAARVKASMPKLPQRPSVGVTMRQPRRIVDGATVNHSSLLPFVWCENQASGLQVLKDGKYSVWFRTPLAEGTGVVVLTPNGRLSGGDTVLSYIGHWRIDGEQFEATVFTARHSAKGQPSVARGRRPTA